MHTLTITEISQRLRAKEFSSSEITQHFLSRIKSLDAKYNAFISLAEDRALAQASEADKRLAMGNAPPMCGVPIAHKDIFCTEAIRTTCGSKMLNSFVPPYNATIVHNFNAHGAVTLGKTNMDEFAMGSSNENSFYGPVKNPWDTACVPGGSSGGSAASVAARFVPGATASDTGGSIRQPASLCGITGLKPTYGRVSRWGMIAFASSLDQAGTMARTAQDTAMMLNVMAGYDSKDSTSIDESVEDYTAHLNNSLQGLTIGVPTEYFSDRLDAKTQQAVEEAIKTCESLGAKVKSISLAHNHLAVPAYYVIAPAECSSNLSRFDGVRYGHQCDNPKDLEDLYTRSREEGFGEEVKRRILVGTYALSAGYYDAYYSKAQKVRRLVKQDFVEAFQRVDVIMGPTTLSSAFGFGEKSTDPVAMYLEDVYTIAVNLAGLPGMSIPCGMVDNKPVGLQLIGNYFQEAKLINIAHQFQLNTDFHSKSPTV